MGISSSSINFKKNSPPSNGSCSINPLNGTTTTVFTISCLNWFDENGIKDYSLYSKRIMIGFSFTPTFKVRLPASSLINLNVHIRDKYNCITEYNISSVYVSEEDSKMNSFTNELLIGNQNDIGQILISISQEFNKINSILKDEISITHISISTLNSQTSKSVNNFISFNKTTLDEYNKKLNIYANIREYLINFTTNLPIVDSNSIIFQASSLVQLTESTNQLTRLTLVIASNKCYQLSVRLNEISLEISYEDVQMAVTLLTQCTSNILNVNLSLEKKIFEMIIFRVLMDHYKKEQIYLKWIYYV